MINFCKKSVHSLLNITSSTTLTSPDENSFSTDNHHCPTPHPVGGGVPSGLSILPALAEIPKISNVIESSTAMAKATDIISSSPAKRERCGIGLSFLDGSGYDYYMDGFASCTESLGFESSNERSNTQGGFDEEMERIREINKSRVTGKSRKVDVKKEVRTFPPPLTSLNNDGKQCLFYRPVRTKGRLELTEVKMKGLLASREEKGRLILHLVEDADEIIDHEDTNDAVPVAVAVAVSDVEANQSADIEEEEKVVGEEKKVVEDEDTKLECPASTSGGGEDCMWLHEMVESHGHPQNHHDMHGWGQRCVTIS